VGEEGKRSGDELDKGAAKGQAGFRALGASASKLAEEMGIPYKASHQLGEKVSDVARTALPAWGTALGLAGVAIAGVVLAVSHFTEREKQLNDEFTKTFTSLQDNTQELYRYSGATDEVTSAKYRLLLATRAEYLLNYPKQLQLQQEELDKLKQKYKEIQSGEFSASFSAIGNAKTQKQLFAETAVEIGKADAKLQLLKATYEQIKAQTPSLSDWMKPKDKEGDDGEYWAKQHAQSWAGYEEERRIQEENRSAQEAREWEYNQLMLQANREYSAASIAQDQQVYAAKRQLQMTYTQGWLTVGAQALDAYIAVTGKSNMVLFALQKSIAIGQIMLDGTRAAMGAAASVAGIPVVGPAMATAAYGEMMTLTYTSAGIAAAAALGQMVTGTWNGGGGGSTAMPTYSALPGTNLPASSGSMNQASGGDTYIIMKDSRDNETARYKIAGDVLQTIYEQNGSVNGYQADVRKNA
jgi:hypothetical protein